MKIFVLEWRFIGLTGAVVAWIYKRRAVRALDGPDSLSQSLRALRSFRRDTLLTAFRPHAELRQMRPSSCFRFRDIHSGRDLSGMESFAPRPWSDPHE